MRPRILGLLVVAALGMGGAPRAADRSPDPFDFFAPPLLLQDGDREKLAHGGTIVRVVPGSAHAIAVFSATAIEADGDRLFAWVRDIAALKRSDHVLAIGRFSTPPRLEDVAALTLDENDISEIRKCRPGRCSIKLADDEIETLQRAVQGGGGTHAIEEAFRPIILRRAERYLTSGATASSGAHFSELLKQSPFLARQMPDVAEALDHWPHAPLPRAESFLYWSKERFGPKPVVSVTHLLLLRGGDGPEPEALVVGRQVFATHYMDGSLSVTAIFRDPAGSTRYLAYLNRSDVDVLGGLLGGVVRRIVERRVRSEAPAALEMLRNRVQSGTPPRLSGAVQ